MRLFTRNLDLSTAHSIHILPDLFTDRFHWSPLCVVLLSCLFYAPHTAALRELHIALAPHLLTAFFNPRHPSTNPFPPV